MSTNKRNRKRRTINIFTVKNVKKALLHEDNHVVSFVPVSKMKK